MKQLVLATLLLAALMPSPALGQRKSPNKKPSSPATERTRMHWQSTPFCPGPTRCDRSALWYDSQHGTILLLWEGATLTVKIRVAETEQVICLTPEGRNDTFWKEVDVACPSCPILADKSRVPYKQLRPVDTGQDKVPKPWVQAALKALHTEETQARSLIQ